VTQTAFATYLLAPIAVAALSNVLLAQNLYIIEKDGVYGFADKSGTLVIPPKYGLAKAFREGLAPVYISGKWGYIDSEGNMKIQPHFWDADNFSDGMAAVRLKGGWGYVDREGNLVIQPRFLQARRFSEGAAPVKSDKGWLFVDTAGIHVEGLSGFEDARSFCEGLAAVRVGGRWRFISHKVNQQFGLELVNASNFGNQRAAVQEEENGKYGFIDHSGRYVINPTFEDAKPFTEGLAAVRRNKRWGYLKKSGEMQIPNNYPLFADEFTAGLAVVSDPVDGAQMYINADDKTQFFKSKKPAEVDRGKSDYTMVALKVSSVPPKAKVYLVPAYIWDMGNQNQTPLSRLKDTELRAYLADHFELLGGQTDSEIRIIEQTYVALFILGEDMQRRKLDVRIGDNSASVSFDTK
jgi:hypothetical protein